MYRQSHPPLEPALADPENQAALRTALAEVGVLDAADDDPLDDTRVDGLFRGAHKDGDDHVPAGPAAGMKGEFAFALADAFDNVRPGAIHVPTHIREVFDFVFEGLIAVAELDPGNGPAEPPDEVPVTSSEVEGAEEGAGATPTDV